MSGPGARAMQAKDGSAAPAGPTTAGPSPHPVAALGRSAGNAAVHRLLGAGGDPLPPQARAEMEARFGADFGGVRVHTGPRAAEAAETLGAKALTVGSDVAFGEGRFAPESREGKRLLAHELAHVVQQGRGGAEPPTQDGSGPLEAAAEGAAAAVVGGSGPVAVAGASAPGIACDPEDERRKRIANEYLLSQGNLAADLQKQGIGQGAPQVGTITLGTPLSKDVQAAADLAFAQMSKGQPVNVTPSVAPGQIEAGQIAVKAGVLKAPPKLAPKPAPPPLRDLLPPPRTDFERKAFDANMKRVYKDGKIVGFIDTRVGVTHLLDIEGKSVTTLGEKPLESPLIDPIDVIPFEALGSLAAKAATFTGKAVVRSVTRAGEKEAATLAAKAGGREVAGEVGSVLSKEAITAAEQQSTRAGGRAAVSAEVSEMVERGIVEEAEATVAASRPRLPRPASNQAGRDAREAFRDVRGGHAGQLGVDPGGQVHHAVELQALNRYPGVFSEAELNAFQNMRGIRPELAGKRQFHNSKIREILDRHYRGLDELIGQQGLQPGTAEYNRLVRSYLSAAREEVDAMYGFLFSEARLAGPAAVQAGATEGASGLASAAPPRLRVAVPEPAPPRLRVDVGPPRVRVDIGDELAEEAIEVLEEVPKKRLRLPPPE